MSECRAVSNVIGVVLILALTVTMVTSLMVIGAVALNETKSQTQNARLENAMAELSSKASLVALGESGSYRFDLGNVAANTVELDEEAGGIHIYLDDPDNGTSIYQTDSLGAVVYEQDDRTVAYQGGGVWGEWNHSGGRMISPPEFHYREETLTLPIIRVSGTGSSTGEASGQIKRDQTTTEYPDGNLTNPVDNATVFIEINSTYHRGWFNYVDERSDGHVEHDPANESVTIELKVPFLEDYDSALAVSESYDLNGNADINEDEIEEDANYPSVSDEIDNKIADCEAGGCEPFEDKVSNGAMEFTGGTTYFTDEEETFDDDIIFDTTEGDINVVINGSLSYGQQDIIVEGENETRIYTTEPPAFGNHDVNMNGTTTAGQFRVFMHSDIDSWSYDENPTVRGVIYAPNTHIELTGSFELIGTLIAETVESNSASLSIQYDENLEDADLGFDHALNVIRYLHVTVNDVIFSLD